jgi:hypothetical protein
MNKRRQEYDMQNAAPISPFLKTARIVGLVSAILTIIFQMVLLYAKFHNSIGIFRETYLKETYLEVAIMIMLAIIAILGSLKLKPTLLFIAFLVSFFYPDYSHSVVIVPIAPIVPIIYKLTRLCSLLYLIAGLIIFIQKKKIEAARIIGLTAAILTIALYALLGAAMETYSLLFASMIALAVLSGWGSLKLKPIILFLAFLGSFFPIGFYMLSLHGIFKLIGICDLLFLVAGIVMYVQKKKQKETSPVL